MMVVVARWIYHRFGATLIESKQLRRLFKLFQVEKMGSTALAVGVVRVRMQHIRCLVDDTRKRGLIDMRILNATAAKISTRGFDVVRLRKGRNCSIQISARRQHSADSRLIIICGAILSYIYQHQHQHPFRDYTARALGIRSTKRGLPRVFTIFFRKRTVKRRIFGFFFLRIKESCKGLQNNEE